MMLDRNALPLLEEEPAVLENEDPVVARPPGGAGPWVPLAGFTVAGILLFAALNSHRTAHAEAQAGPSGGQIQKAAWAAVPPLDLPAQTAPAVLASTPPAALVLPRPAPPGVLPATPFAGGESALAQRRRAPTLVVDYGGAGGEMVLAQAGPAPASVFPPATTTPSGRPELNDSEQFARRVGAAEPDRAYATPMTNLQDTIVQGAIIPGVLETAIDSDLPGFARAVVSRDVLSFDGKSVLIPRGSRLIGQYKSAVALGQSRAFIIWTRVIRPDGVSILIGSPGTDQLGRGGLDGEVNRHFFQRFSGSILLSVLNAAVASIGRTPSTQISIGSPAAASGLAGAIVEGQPISPTIKVAQGASINIFVARDLDFSGVGPAR